MEAAYTTQKEDLLLTANRKVNSTRYLLRLAKDLKLMSVDSYSFSTERLDEIGRMVGGSTWRTHPCVRLRHSCRSFVVQGEKRRDESRRCTQECVRHEDH